jgi:surface antigen
VEQHVVFGTRYSKEVLGLGLALGLTFALAVPVSRMIVGTSSWPPSDSYRSVSSSAKGNVTYNIHMVPYGLDRGLCDRGRLAADLKAGTAVPTDSLVGNVVGSKMDVIDQNCVGDALEFAPDHRQIIWRNSNNGLTYTLVATQTFQNERGIYCRNYDASTVIAGQTHQVRGVACRQPAGSWAAAR